MALSEFRYNKRRKHYAYIFGKKGQLYKNILLTSKPKRKKKKKNGNYKVYKNVALYKHPNPNKNTKQYVIDAVVKDTKNSFSKTKLNWQFHKYDKRKIKRIKKGKWE
ncbi:MAG: hypothetical protein J6B04_01305 [Clostridia bacterium]|nr:hypothetical protein [Clostridia bacterium]